jgi:ABC-2 type transport system permease protein
MIGLILKDLLYLKRVGKVLAALLIFYAVFMSNSNRSSVDQMLSGVTIMLTMVLCSSAFSYDEAAKWRLYELSFPVSKKQIVLARYLFSAGLVTVLPLLSCLLKWIIFRDITADNVAVLSVSWGVSLLLCSILFPLFYRYGMQKARLILLLLLLIPSFGIALFQPISIPAPSESSLLLLIRLFPVVAALVFFASYWISCHFYASKDN